MMRALPWLLVVALFFFSLRNVITWAWLPWMLCIGLVSALGWLLSVLGEIFRR